MTTWAEMEFLDDPIIPPMYHKDGWVRDSVETDRISKKTAHLIGARPCTTCYPDTQKQ